ncbi:MAG: hypothetical protein ABI947_14470 [Chloroflexota bacterium]
MTAQTRLTQVEKGIEDMALALVERKYGLTADDLAAMADLCKAIKDYPYKHNNMTVRGITDSLIAVLSEHDQQQARLLDLWAAAGLDYDRQATAWHEVFDDYQIPPIVTIETCLDLDRQVYERCRIDVIAGKDHDGS